MSNEFKNKFWKFFIAFWLLILYTPEKNFFVLKASTSPKILKILVYPFVNSGAHKHSWISVGLTDTVISDLSAIPNLYVISHTDRKMSLQEIQLGQKGVFSRRSITRIGQMTGAQIILTGSYVVMSGQIRINARLIHVATAMVLNSIKVDGRMNNFFSVQDKIVLSLMKYPGRIKTPLTKPVQVNALVKNQIVLKHKPGLDAFRFYSLGLEMRDKNPRQGLAYFKKAYGLDEQYVDALIKISFMLGRVYNQQKQAFIYLSKAEKILLKSKRRESAKFAFLQMNMGITYGAMGQWRQAKRHYFIAKAIYENLGLQQSKDYPVLLTNIAAYYQNAGQFQQATHIYRKILKIRQQIGLGPGQAQAALLNNMGNLFKMRGDLSQALDYYTKARTIQDQIGLTGSRQQSVTLNNMGLIFFNQRKLAQALQFFNQALAIRKRLKLQNTREYASLLMNKGIVFSIRRKHKNALYFFNQAQRINLRLRTTSTKSYASLLMNIGSTYYAMGHPRAALNLYIESKNLKQKLGLNHQATFAHTIRNMGLVYLRLGHKQRAVNLFRQALQIYQEAGYRGRSYQQTKRLIQKYQ